MLKIIFCFFLAFICHASFANLYLQTEYQEGRKPKVTTKQHIFLEKRYTINYDRKSYVLILKKINGNEVTIESESYDVNKVGHKTMHGGAFGTYKVGNSFSLTDNSSSGEKLFNLKITLEKLIEMKP